MRATAYILNSNPGIARSFVGILRGANVELDPGSANGEPPQEGDIRPDVTVHDRGGRAQALVENEFWVRRTGE